MLFLDDQNYQGRAIPLSDPIEKLSDFIGSGRDSSKDVGFLGTEFRWEVVGCRNILESNRNPDILALSDIRQLPIRILSQGFYRNSLDPIGSYWVHSFWVASEIFIIHVSLYFSFTILFHFNRISSFEWQRIRTRSFWRDWYSWFLWNFSDLKTNTLKLCSDRNAAFNWYFFRNHRLRSAILLMGLFPICFFLYLFLHKYAFLLCSNSKRRIFDTIVSIKSRMFLALFIKSHETSLS